MSGQADPASGAAKLRVFLGPVEVAGYYVALAEGLRALGVAVEQVNTVPHPFRYDGRLPSAGIFRCWYRLNGWRGIRSGIFRRLASRLLLLPVRMLAVLHLARCYDVLVFGFAQTCTGSWMELALYRVLGKRLVFVFHGSDNRPPYCDVECAPGNVIDLPRLRRRTAARWKWIRTIERYADVIVTPPAQAQFHSRPVVNWFCIGIPFQITDLSAPRGADVRAIRILHCPSHPVAKGTAAITEAIARLRAKGHDIEFVLIQGQSNARVREELARCDFVIDQLYSDVPMASFACEAAHFGKPAVVGGYFAPLAARFIAPEMTPPTLFVLPELVEEAIERLITDVAFRLDLGQRAQRFVREQWQQKKVAERFLRIVQGSVPADWMFDPQGAEYLHGCGLPEWRVRETVSALAARYGSAVLRVDDKPGLLRGYLTWCGKDS